MPTFEEFVQTELPKRPFVTNDGSAGQVLARSNDPTHPLELVWTTPGGGSATSQMTFEAGENITRGTPVKVVANKVYAASHVDSPIILGLSDSDTLLGFSTTITIAGPIALTGLSAGSPYFLGNGVITNSPPSSGYIIRLGSAVSASTLLIEIEQPILLT